MAHSNNSIKRGIPSILSSSTIDSSPKPSTPLISLQMLVDNRHSQMKNMTEKKDSLDIITDSEESNINIHKYREHPQNPDKITQIENNIALHESRNEFPLLDTNLSSSFLVSSYINDSRLNVEKQTAPKMKPIRIENNQTEVIKSDNYDKFPEASINGLKKVFNFSPDVTIEKVAVEKKEYEVLKYVDESSDTNLQKHNILPIVNSIYKVDQITKNYLPDQYDSRKNVKSYKTIPKKGKIVVDSLLEKLENCTKKLSTFDNIVTMPTNIEEKDSSSVKSMSPEYAKTRSPNNREYDVISPSFDNDDSNDMKQRRKRKLGKPIRLSKDLKPEYGESEYIVMNPKSIDESETLKFSIDPDQCSQFERLSSQIHQHTSVEFESTPRDNMKIFTSEKDENKIILTLSSRNESEILSLKNKMSHDKNSTKNLGDLTKSLSSNKNKLKELSQCIRTRRSSECVSYTSNKIQKKRRRSCNDIKEILFEPDPKISSINNVLTFNEVESQLEKMFAGIIETDKDLLRKSILAIEKSNCAFKDDDQKENMISDKIVASNYKNEVKKNASKLRCHKKKSFNSFKKISHFNYGNSRKEKKKKFSCKKSSQRQGAIKNKKKDIGTEKFRETLDVLYNTSVVATKYKGPVIQIKGLKDNPMNVQIINTPREDDEERNREKRKNVGNGTIGRSQRLNYQNNLDYRGRSFNSGFFNSTLSTRYDANTADVTWICVFCKRGPHFLIHGDSSRPHPNVTGPHIASGTYTVPAGVLSDLFGPYLIEENSINDDSISLIEQEIIKEQKKGSGNKRNLAYLESPDPFGMIFNKANIKIPPDLNNIHIGMTQLDGDKQQWEVWIHEQCIMWSAGVYVTGGRISGLQDAVWDAVTSNCDFCGLSGANIGCIRRGCKSISHYCCALTNGWHLDADQYIPKCSIHRIP